MASLGQLVLITGMAFLVLASQDQGHGGPAGGGVPAVGAAAAIITPQPPLTPALTESKRGPIPKSGPSDGWNYEVNHEKPSSSAQSGSGRRRTRAIVVGRRLGSA